jgi:hypothetical protein
MAQPKGKRRAAPPGAGKAARRAARSPANEKRPAPRAKGGAAVSGHLEPAATPRTKAEACLALLVRPGGASIAELQQLTGWQAHSVRGFLAGTVKKIPGASLTSEKTEDARRYYLRRAQKNHD